MIQRMLGVLRLDPHVFEEIEADREATNQAFMIVVLAGVAGVTANLGAWSLFAFLAWLVGTHLFGTPRTRADWDQLARTIGFAYTLMLLSAAGVIPAIGRFIALGGLAWFVVATIVALRQALDFSTPRAISTGLVSLAGYGALSLAFFALLDAAVP